MNNLIETENPDFKLKIAEKTDVPKILELIKGIAEYEKLLNQVTATEEILNDSLFVKKSAEVILAIYKNKVVGFALFFHNFSTFTGKRGLYLEDFFIYPEYRHKGFGKIIFTYLAKLALERDCTRFEWICLDWNEPSKMFYKKMGAVPLDEWTVHRLDGASLKNFKSL